MTPIAQAVQPLKQDAQDQAERAFRARAAWVLEKLTANGMDQDKAFPHPHGRMSRAEYRQADAQMRFCQRLTTWVKPTRRHGESNIRTWVPEAVERVAAEWREMAGQSFDAFVAKLEVKVGEHDGCEMLVNGTWGYSILAVHKGETTERWKTQQIINCSGLGTLYNQWPTRLMK